MGNFNLGGRIIVTLKYTGRGEGRRNYARYACSAGGNKKKLWNGNQCRQVESNENIKKNYCTSAALLFIDHKCGH